MPTYKKRINITVSEHLDDALEYLAKRDQMPQATKAAELLRVAIEIEEDDALDKLVSLRDNKKSEFISHKKAWL